MVELEGFAEPDPIEYFLGSLDGHKHRLLTYTMLVGTPSLLQVLLFLLILTSNALHTESLINLSVQFFLLFLVIGSTLIFYYLVSFLISTYKFANSRLDLKPIPKEKDIRLQVRQGGLKEEYGVQLSNARSLVIGLSSAFIASIWMSFIDSLRSIVGSSAVTSLNNTVQQFSSEKATETFVTIASAATRTDVQNLITLLNPSDYYILVKFVPPVIIGYISFIHIGFLLNKLVENGNRDSIAGNELRGLIEYLRYSYKDLQNSGVGTEFWEIFKLTVAAITVTIWQLGLLWSLFF